MSLDPLAPSYLHLQADATEKWHAGQGGAIADDYNAKTGGAPVRDTQVVRFLHQKTLLRPHLKLHEWDLKTLIEHFVPWLHENYPDHEADPHPRGRYWEESEESEELEESKESEESSSRKRRRDEESEESEESQ